MSRSYNKVRPKVHHVYSVAEVLALYDICRNTLSNWVGQGLHPSTGGGEQLFRGAELLRFHTARRKRTRRELRQGEFKCLGCKAAVSPDICTVSFERDVATSNWVKATCPDCERSIVKLLSETECNFIKKCHDTNTSLGLGDESLGGEQVGIGTIDKIESDNLGSVNDRVLYDWQSYAGQYAPKTVDAHLAAIREFESFLEGISFEKLTTLRVGTYRDNLLERAHPDAGEAVLSRSSMKHKASHVSAFLTWLLKQPGYRRLPADLADYLKLPKSVRAKTFDPIPKDYPKFEVAVAMVEGMRTDTLKAQRERGIVATAFVSGLRAGALSTLRLKHVDVEAKTVFQDALEMKAKNGKTYVANWFTGTESLQTVLIDWIETLNRLGFGPEDALFPSVDYLVPRPIETSGRRGPIPPLQSEAVIATAFAAASVVVGAKYSPHSARHSLKALGDKLCINDAQRKAWSRNLGHSSRITTEDNYGKMTDLECRNIFGEIGVGTVQPQAERDLCLAYFEQRLERGTPEFAQAKYLIAKREREWEESNVLE